MEHNSNDQEDRPNQHEKSLARRWNETCRFEFNGKLLETETTAWLDFPNGWKAIAEQILASEEINKSKRAGCDSHSQGFE